MDSDENKNRKGKETIKNKAYEKVLEEKKESPKSNLDIAHNNLIENDNLSNNSVIITKPKKMNEFEN